MRLFHLAVQVMDTLEDEGADDRAPLASEVYDWLLEMHQAGLILPEGGAHDLAALWRGEGRGQR
jgi:hypothetical protein